MYDGLDRVDDDDLRLLAVERGDDRLELHFGEQRHRRVDQRQPLGAQRDLLDRLLAGDVERLSRRADRCHRLQQQRRLADARVAAQQDHAAGNEASAQHPVELLDAGGKPRHVPGRDRAQRPDFAAGAGQALETRRGGRRHRLDQRVPSAAVRTLALPLRQGPAALGATEQRLRLGHARPRARGDRQASSSGVTVAVPSLPTTTPAAWLAMRIAARAALRRRSACPASRSPCRRRRRRRKPRARARARGQHRRR